MKNCIVTVPRETYFRLARAIERITPDPDGDRAAYRKAFYKHYNCQDVYRSDQRMDDAYKEFMVDIVFANIEDALWFRLKWL